MIKGEKGDFKLFGDFSKYKNKNSYKSKVMLTSRTFLCPHFLYVSVTVGITELQSLQLIQSCLTRDCSFINYFKIIRPGDSRLATAILMTQSWCQLTTTVHVGVSATYTKKQNQIQIINTTNIICLPFLKIMVRNPSSASPT